MERRARRRWLAVSQACGVGEDNAGTMPSGYEVLLPLRRPFLDYGWHLRWSSFREQKGGNSPASGIGRAIDGRQRASIDPLQQNCGRQGCFPDAL